jgi:SAM-dependent methyltransferase
LRTQTKSLGPVISPDQSETVAAVYNAAGDDYLAYADGNSKDLFAFEGPHSSADRQLWGFLKDKLQKLKASGKTSVSFLDAGCGPGTWLRRLVTYACELGFERITARGFDLAETQVRRARVLAHDLSNLSGVTLVFDVADLITPLPEADKSVDLSLCLYSVLSHLSREQLPGIFAEIARVTAGDFVVTVRPAGSPPTIFIDTLEKARSFRHYADSDTCKIELVDGQQIALHFHLFSVSELRDCFTPHYDIQDLRGLDLFHSRFAPDARWNPLALRFDKVLFSELEELEEIYAGDPAFMERASHLLVSARPKKS